jgi:hypothetical protein
MRAGVDPKSAVRANGAWMAVACYVAATLTCSAAVAGAIGRVCV